MRKNRRLPQGLLLLIGLVLGLIFGYLLPQGLQFYDFLGTAFIDLISMVIIPLVISKVIVSVANSMTEGALAGRLVTIMVYFFIITTAIIIIFVFGGYYLGFGNSFSGNAPAANIDGLASDISLYEFLLGLIPSNIFQSLAEGNLLTSTIFAIIFGAGLAAVGEKAKPLVNLFDIIADAFYKITLFVVKLLPIGVFGFVARDVAEAGFSSLISLSIFVVGMYIGYLILALVIFPLVSLIFNINYIQLTKDIWDLLVVAFVSGSSSVVLPQLISRLKTLNFSEKITNLTIPLGYTFNLDGASVYLALASVFVINIYNMEMSLIALLTLSLLLTIIGKTIAAIPSGAIVVLLAAASQLGLPAQGVAMIVSVDFFVNAGRTALNVLGNALAVGVIENYEKRRTQNVK